MRKKMHSLSIILLVFLFVLGVTGSVFAQTIQQPDSSLEIQLTNLINTMDLPSDQFNGTLKLTKEYLNQIHKSGTAITKVMTVKNSDPQADPKLFEKTIKIQREFLDKTKQYNSAMVTLIDQEKADKIYGQIYPSIPKYLLPQVMMAESQKMTQMENPPGNEMAKMQTMNGMMQDNMSNMNNMSQMNGMDKMQGMDNMSQMNGMNNMTQMNGMNNMGNMMGNNSMMMGMSGNMGTMPGMNTDPKLQSLAQLQSSNAMIMQMISSLSKQSNGTNVQAQLQALYQMLANQTALIQMLNNNAMNMGQNGSSNSNSSNGGSMNGMGMM